MKKQKFLEDNPPPVEIKEETLDEQLERLTLYDIKRPRVKGQLKIDGINLKTRTK